MTLSTNDYTGMKKESTNMKICSVEGCEREYLARGYCRLHYDRLKRYGDVQADKIVVHYTICIVEDCGRKPVGKGYCSKHYERFKKHGDPNYQRQIKHGTRATYQRYNCRCDECVEANYISQKMVHDNLKTKQPPEHGTRNAYINYGCRCDECKKAQSPYNIWFMMINRCHNPNDLNYKYYGARGIKVCDKWRYSFEDFYKDMWPQPESDERLTIDRINNDGDYEPANVKWSTYKEQAQNRRPKGTALVMS